MKENQMNRHVTLARFHQSIHVPGVGELGNTIPIASKAASRNWKMRTESQGLHVDVNGIEILVPWANVVMAQLGEEIVQLSFDKKPATK